MRAGESKPAKPLDVSPASFASASAVLPVVGCALLVALSAQVRIPIPGTDVPMTLQLLAVLLTGFLLSPGRAVTAMFLYLACGAAGLPVFAGTGGGVATTGGYLVGFAVAAWLVSAAKGGRDAGGARLLAAAVLGTLAVFALGIAWRVAMMRGFGFLGGDVSLAVTTGLLPFLAKAVVEILLAVTFVLSIRGRRLYRSRGKNMSL